MSDEPDTPLWQELRRQAARSGVLAIAVRSAASQSAEDPCVVDLTWPGGETEHLRFNTAGDLDALALAIAGELRIALAPRDAR
jgi:hypothetical protein